MFKYIILLLTINFNIAIANASSQFHQTVIKYLASEQLEGRRAGSVGNELAVQYAEQTFKALGVKPLEEKYTEDFTIFTEMEKIGDNFVTTTEGKNEINFAPISFSLSGDLSNTSVVFLGYGISIPKNDEKIKYDDYENIDVTDKIVVVLTGDPGVKNPKSPFRDPDYISYRSIHYKLKNAINHGAKGILIISDPLSLENYPKENLPVFNATEGGGDRFNIISGYVTNSWFNQFLSDTDTLSLQKEITTTEKPRSFALDTKLNFSVHLKKKTGRVSNIIGVIPGTDETLKREVVVIGGHVDHLGYGGESSMEQNSLISPLKTIFKLYNQARNKAFYGKIHPGADDNASGTSMVLKLAKELSQKKLKRTYVFVLFNAEEVGLLGSASFVENWAQHEETYGKIVSMLNFDMVGRYSNEVSVMGVNTGLEWKELLSPLKSSLNYELKNEAIGSSDHASFIAKKIPSLFFTTGAHPDYHTSRDTFEKINFSAMENIESYSLDLITALEKSAITYNSEYSDGQGEGRGRGYGAHLGCVPEFGQPDSVKGVICTRATAGSPAEKAGILPNDVLVQIGDIEVSSIYDLAFALKYYRAGDEIELGYKRLGVLIKAKIILQKSKRE